MQSQACIKQRTQHTKQQRDKKQTQQNSSKSWGLDRLNLLRPLFSNHDACRTIVRTLFTAFKYCIMSDGKIYLMIVVEFAANSDLTLNPCTLCVFVITFENGRIKVTRLAKKQTTNTLSTLLFSLSTNKHGSVRFL